LKRELEVLLRRGAARTGVIGLAGGLPSVAQFPRRALALSFLRVMRQAGTPALQYGWAEGSGRLRGYLAQRLNARGVEVRPDDVIVTSGAQQGIAMALELATRPTDVVGFDLETYPAALELARCRGLVPAGRLRDVSCAYVMPAVSNPRGRALSDLKRTSLLGERVAIIEDDAYAELRFADGPAPRPLLADATDRVFHVGTFSKILCPGLRVGWLVVPRHLRRRALELKQGIDLQSSTLAQAIVEDYLLGDGHRPGVDLDDRLLRLRRFYAGRAARLATALRKHLPGWSFDFPEGGFAIWVETDTSQPEEPFLKAALDEGVTFDPGSQFRPDAGGAEPLALRLCFSSARADSLELAIQRLARAWTVCQPTVVACPGLSTAGPPSRPRRARRDQAVTTRLRT